MGRSKPSVTRGAPQTSVVPKGETVMDGARHGGVPVDRSRSLQSQLLESGQELRLEFIVAEVIGVAGRRGRWHDD